MKRAKKKEIKVEIAGAACEHVKLEIPPGTKMNTRKPDLKDVKNVYVVYEVFYAESVVVSVSIGECWR